jgi:hypothetical protein
MDEDSRRDHLFAKKDFKEWLAELKAEEMSIMMMIIDLQAAKDRRKSMRQAIDPTVNNITGSLGGRFNQLVKTIGEEGISDGITAAIDDFIEELEKRQREFEWRIYTIKEAEINHPKHDDDSNGPSGAGDEFNVTNITDI